MGDGAEGVDEERAEADVLVVGGGPAGLAAAVVLGRSRRRVVVVDAGAPRNAPAEGVHAFLTRDGTPPDELLGIARAEVARYGGQVRVGRAVSATRDDEGFVVRLADGSEVGARRLVVAIGIVDELPDVEGLADRWGRDVVHCPYCHGWEVRDRHIGVLVTTDHAARHAAMFRQLSERITLLTHTGPPPTAEELATLRARGVEVVDGEVARVLVTDDAITGVRLDDGREVVLEVLAVAPRARADAALLSGFGLASAAHPSGLGDHVPAAPGGATDVPGVYVAGNVTDPMAQVVAAAAQGTAVGAMVNADLVEQDGADARSAA